MQRTRHDGTERGLEGLPARIKLIRETHKMTQRDLAEKANLTADHISHFECGQRLPSVPNLRALAIALNTSADYLLDS